MTRTTNARAMWWACSALFLTVGIAGCGGGSASSGGGGGASSGGGGGASGGGDGGGGGGPPRLTTSQFVEQANAACVEDQERNKSQPYQPTPAARARQHLPVFDKLIARLGELRPPQKLDAKYQQYLSRLRRERELFKQALTTPQPYDNLSPEVPGLLKEDRTFLDQVGLDECARY